MKRHMTQDNLCQVCLLCLPIYILIISYLNCDKIAPNNQNFLELREKALEEQKKLQESQGEKVKKENNQTLLFVADNLKRQS